MPFSFIDANASGVMIYRIIFSSFASFSPINAVLNLVSVSKKLPVPGISFSDNVNISFSFSISIPVISTPELFVAVEAIPLIIILPVTFVTPWCGFKGSDNSRIIVYDILNIGAAPEILIVNLNM